MTRYTTGLLAWIHGISRAKAAFMYLPIFEKLLYQYLSPFLKTEEAPESLGKKKKKQNNQKPKNPTNQIKTRDCRTSRCPLHTGLIPASLLPVLQWTRRDLGARTPSSDHWPGQWPEISHQSIRLQLPQWKTTSWKHTLNTCLFRKVETSKPLMAEWSKHTTWLVTVKCQVLDLYPAWSNKCHFGGGWIIPNGTRAYYIWSILSSYRPIWASPG